MQKTWLVVGLGNPEGKYFRTYHNVGFLCAEKLAQKMLSGQSMPLNSNNEADSLFNTSADATLLFKKKGNQLICDFKIGGRQCGTQAAAKATDTKVFVLKPLTYMNLSGQAVVAVARKQKIAQENIIVFADDLYIDKGSIRIAFGGSNAGHNGIKSINELLGTNQYIKIKVGIKPEKPPYSTSDYVLKKIDEQSLPLVGQSCEKAVQAAAMLLSGETLSKVQNMFNSRQDA